MLKDNERVLAVIPARGGSKGVIRKNVRQLGGKPLIAWTIEAALHAGFVDQVLVSTDDAEIAEVSQQYGADVPFMRDAKLAQDDSTTIDVVVDALQRCSGFDWVVLLQPTSPLRTATDIDKALALCIEKNAPSCVSVCLAESSPYWMFTLNDEHYLNPLLPATQATRRQDLPPVYSLNGAIYVAKVEWLLEHKKFVTPETVAYTMPVERSIDLDTELDFRQLQIILGD